MEKERYRHLNSYLKNKFGGRTLKVCIDANFTCPNRDGVKGYGGCLFCGSMGAGENIKYKTSVPVRIEKYNNLTSQENHYESARMLRWQDNNCMCDNEVLDSIRSQVTNFLNSYRGERADRFIAYFQSFTNTYASVDYLKSCYDEALNSSEKFVGLQVATRPDCIDEEVVKLLASYKDRYYVCVELGLQTSNEDVGKLINRGYTNKDFEEAVKLLHLNNIDVVAHVMVGLPNESCDDVMSTIDFVNKMNCNGVKIHSTYVQKGTGLAKMYLDGRYIPITQEYYIDVVGKIISRLNEDVVIHRITADPPKGESLAPEWILHKKVVINSINRMLEDKDIIQGKHKIY